MQSNNSIISNNQMSHHHQQLQQQLQQHLSNQFMQNGMSSSGVGASGSVGNNVLSELPEPPSISVSEIGPIPPPPMFSTPSPTMVAGRPHGPGVQGMSHEFDYDGESSFISPSSSSTTNRRVSDEDEEQLDSDEEYYHNHNIDTSRIDEIPAKEPKFNAVPLKSALKKKSSNPGTPTQDGNRTLLERQANSSFK